MAASVDVTYNSACTAIEKLDPDNNAIPAGSNKVTHNEYNTSKSLNGTSTPPVTKVVSFEASLSGGAYTIDLTALTGTAGATVDGAGLRVQVFKFINKSGNTGVMTISSPATTGYDGFGAKTVYSEDVAPGGEIMKFPNDAGGDIANGTNDEIDISGTGSEAFQCQIVLG